jgi:hypothetical protein
MLAHWQLNLLWLSRCLRLLGRLGLICWLRLLSRFSRCCWRLLGNGSGLGRSSGLGGTLASLFNGGKSFWVLGDMLEEAGFQLG